LEAEQLVYRDTYSHGTSRNLYTI